MVLLRPGVVRLVIQLLVGEAECAQTLVGELLKRLVRLLLALVLPVGAALKDDRVCTLAEHDDFAVRVAPQNDAHPLPRRGELDHLQHIERELLVLAGHLQLCLVAHRAAEHVPVVRRGLHKRLLVGRLGLVADAGLGQDRGVHRVAQRQALHKPAHRLVLLVVRVVDRLVQLRVAVWRDALDGGDRVHAAVLVLALGLLLFALGLRLGRALLHHCLLVRTVGGGEPVGVVCSLPLLVRAVVDHVADVALTEDHQVLGERTRLVTDDVLDLAELVTEVPRLGRGAPVVLLVVHVVVLKDEERLDGAHNLERDVQRDRHKVLERDQRIGKRNQTVDVGVVVVLFRGKRPVCGALMVILF